MARDRSIGTTLPTLAQLLKHQADRALLCKWWHVAFKPCYVSHNWNSAGHDNSLIKSGAVKIAKFNATSFRDKLSDTSLLYMIFLVLDSNKAEDVFSQFMAAVNNTDEALFPSVEHFGRHNTWTPDLIEKMYETLEKNAGEGAGEADTMHEDSSDLHIDIDPALAKLADESSVIKAIDSLLQSAESPYSMDEIIQVVSATEAWKVQAKTLDKKVDELNHENGRLKRELRGAAAPMQGSFVASELGKDLSIPAGEVVFKKAAEVFCRDDAAKHLGKVLDFALPVFEWEDVHPWVPELDDSYHFDSQTLLPLLATLAAGKNAWLHGHTGTGKTTLIQQVAARLHWPVRRINFDGDISRFDLVGQTRLENDNGTTISTYVDGILPQAMQSPTILLLDELDAGRPDVLYALQNALDQGEFVITDDGARRIKANPFFRAVAACNTQGQGDESGLYPGTRVLSRALLNRFHKFIPIDYMCVEDEQGVLESNVSDLPEMVSDLLMAYVNEHRTAFTSVEITEPISLRNIIGAAEDYVFYEDLCGHEAAVRMAVDTNIIYRANEEDQIVLRGLAQRVFPGCGF
ncbi:MAG: hypothetical protein B0D91_01325 [Oceanospirillales bacterium LUC14_002_19_P2]|nr:MAG: hypothetical protein B0D91_01325 [Oceanospirillales bacterium LUC14_002_19_P2]